MFGSPDASRAIADQAQHFSGVTSDILKKLLPVLAGILISGLMRSKPGQASPSAPQRRLNRVAAHWATSCGRYSDRGHRSPLDRLQAQLPSASNRTEARWQPPR